MTRPGFFLALAALSLATSALADPAHFYTSSATAALHRPFSDAVQVGEVLYLSGQIGVRPGEDQVVPGGMIPQARQVMDNIGSILAERGLGFKDVFKCQVFLADMGQWADFNAVYVGYFKPGHFPARSALGANGLAKGAAVEVECWAKISP